MDKYRVYGNPIAQSKSPFIHSLFAEQTGQSLSYTTQFAEDDEQFLSSITAFFAEGGKGCNVTAPFKEAAFSFAGQLTKRARLAGAVNTLKRLDDGSILGDTTDGAGLVQDMLNHDVAFKDARILLLGAGGAARGVIQSLLAQRPESITVANRTVEKAEQLAVLFSDYGEVYASSISDIAEPQFDIIINSTSAGLTGDIPAISASVIHPEVICYDMVYRAETTAFNQWAMSHGAHRAIDGLGMLVGQAAESFIVWRDVHPDTSQVLNELRRVIQQ